MKFIIVRTSAHEKPCDEAVRENYVKVDIRTVDDPSKLPYGGANWYSEGRNHRVENGMIKRDTDADAWFLELSSLDELVAFHKKYGSLVIDASYCNPDIIEIEIYDDYRE